MSGRKLTRFRKEAYAGKNAGNNTPKWHIAVYPYKKGEPYKEYEALCGYAIKWPCFESIPVLLSNAIKVKDGAPGCSKCVRVQKDIDVTAGVEVEIT